MSKLVLVPLGYSVRKRFCKELQAITYDKSVLVLPNRMLMDEVRSKYTIECIGIDTLASKIINLNGGTSFKQINRRSQELVIKNLLDDIIELKGLDYFDILVNKKGFIKAITSLVGQLSRSGATQEEISTALKYWHNNDEVSNNKYKFLKDQEISLLYNYYQNYLKEKQWFDLESKYRLAIAKLQINDCKVPWGKIYFSDFYSFDNLQLNFIKALAKHCEVQVGLCYEKNSFIQHKGREKFFSAAQTTYNELEAMTLNNNWQLEKYTYPFTRSIVCQHIIENLGMNNEPINADENINIYNFNSAAEEMRWVLTDIKQKLLNGINPENILLTLRDLNKFSGLKVLADEYGIPLTLSKTSLLALQPLTEIIILLMQAKSDNHYGAEAYFRLVTAELAHILLADGYEAVDKLRQNHYFTSRSEAQSYIKDKTNDDSMLILWNNFIANLPLQALLSEYIDLTKKLLEEMYLEEKLGDLYKKGDIDLAQLANTLNSKAGLLNVMSALCEDYQNCDQAEQIITLSQWQDLFVEAIKETNLVLQKGQNNGVVVAEAINVHGMVFDYVYIMGVRESEFPKANNENWIYNDKERIELNALGIDMPTTAQAYSEDAFFFAAAVAAASKSIIITYYSEDDIGASPYIEEIKRLFWDSKLSNNGEKVFLKERKIHFKQPASISELVEKKGKLCEDSYLKRLSEGCNLSQQSIYKRISDLQGKFNGCLNDNTVNLAIRKNLHNSFSASALECYATCPFIFLGTRIWGQQEFSAAEDLVDPKAEGEFLHEVLKEFVSKYLHQRITEYKLTDLKIVLTNIFSDLSNKYLEIGKFANNSLWNAEIPRLKRLLEQWLIFEYQDQQNWPGFTPSAVEWDFSANDTKQLEIPLNDGSKAYLKGRVDRIDSKDNLFFITDYKRSGAPSSKDLENGFDLQLPIYLLAVVQLYGENIKIAGGCYFVLRDVVRKGKFILQATGNKDLPYKCKSENALNSSWEHFQDFCLKLICSYIEKIYLGEFPAAPKKACAEFCPMRDICRIKELEAAKGDIVNYE